jgi:hypothetical protein
VSSLTEVARSPQGGKRKGSGRKPLIETHLCGWIVDKIKETSKRPEVIEMRMRYAVKQQDPRFLEEHDELDKEYKKLQRASLSERKSWIADDFNSPLEEVRVIRSHPGFKQLIHLPPPNQFIMNYIYKTAAEQATLYFSNPVSVRTVKACANAWVRFETEMFSLEKTCEPANTEIGVR